MTGPADWNYWLTTWPAQPTLLTRANAADGYPRPLTPLSQDLVVTYEERGVRKFFTETLGALTPSMAPVPYMWAMWGYIFLNADQLAGLGEIMPGSSRQSVYQQYVGLAPDPAYRAPRVPLRKRVGSLVGAGPVAYAMLSNARSATERFTGQVERIRALRPAQPDVSPAECLPWVLALESLMDEAWESLFIGPGIASATFEVALKSVGKALGCDTAAALDLTNRLHVGLGSNESAEAGRTVRRLAAVVREHPKLQDAIAAGGRAQELRGLEPAFDLAFEAAIERFGFHTANELEVAQPSWRQAPDQLLSTVRRELTRGTDGVGESSARTRAEAEQELARRAKPYARRAVRKIIELSRRQMALRENAKIPIVLIVDELRRVIEHAGPALVAAGAVRAPGDLAYLRFDEFKAVLAGAAGPTLDELDRRIEAHRRCSDVAVPELIEAGPGWVRPITDEHITSRGLLPPEQVTADTRVLTGVAASSGRVSAVARVMSDPDDEFEPGDVLVAKTVDPGWSAALSLAGAVVLDMGGMLSHGAVVARELGIPCVVAVRSASSVIRPGSVVTVDGAAGEVLLDA